MNLEKFNLVELNAIELTSIDGGRKFPKINWKGAWETTKTKVKEAWCCVSDFASGVWEGLTE